MTSIFGATDPFDLVRTWMAEAEALEVNDPNAIALATVDADGLPNVRMVLLKELEDDGFVFYTNYDSRKGQELARTAKAAFVLHWKGLRRQVRVRGQVGREDGALRVRAEAAAALHGGLRGLAACERQGTQQTKRRGAQEGGLGRRDIHRRGLLEAQNASGLTNSASPMT